MVSPLLSIPYASNMSKRPSSSVSHTAKPQTFRWLTMVVLALLATPSHGQVGSTICACSPPTYEFTLNFDKNCENTMLSSPGIAEFECVIQPFQTGATIDLRPVQVETIDFVEFDQANGRLTESSLFDPMQNGDTFTFTSFSADPDAVAVPTVPRAVQITMLAQNSVGQPLLMTWLIAFTNSCAFYPVFSAGNSIGWTEFSAVSEPNESLCPAVNGPPPTPSTPQPPVPTPRPPHPGPIPKPGGQGPCRPPPGKGIPGKGKGGHNIFYGPYAKAAKSSKSHKAAKSGYPWHAKGGGYPYYYYDGYYNGKGKGGYYPDLPICKPPRPPTPSPPVSNSRRSPTYPALYNPSDDDDQVHLRFPPPSAVPVPVPTTPTAPVSSPTVQQAQEQPTVGNSANVPSVPDNPPDVDVANWGSESDSDSGVRAALFAGAGVAAGLLVIFATVLYRREKRHLASEMKLYGNSARLGAIPRDSSVPMAAPTMSATLSSGS